MPDKKDVEGVSLKVKEKKSAEDALAAINEPPPSWLVRWVGKLPWQLWLLLFIVFIGVIITLVAKSCPASGGA